MSQRALWIFILKLGLCFQLFLRLNGISGNNWWQPSSSLSAGPSACSLQPHRSMSETSIVTRGHGAYGRSLQNSRNHLCCTSKLLTVSVGLSSLSCCFYWSCTNTSGCWQERREILATLLDFTWVFHSFHILQDLTQKFDTLPAIRVPVSVLSVGILRNTSQKRSHIQHMGYSKCACFEKKIKQKAISVLQ